MSVRVDVFGLDSMMKRLQELEPKVAKKALRVSLRVMGRVYTREIKKRAGDLNLEKGARKILMRSVFAQVVNRRGKLRLHVRIRKPDRRSDVPGDRAGQEAARQDAYYWRWLEYGTVKRFRAVRSHFELGKVQVSRGEVWDKRGQKMRRATTYRATTTRKVADSKAYTGFIAPQPFVRPAAKVARERALRAFEAELWHHLKEAWERG